MLNLLGDYICIDEKSDEHIFIRYYNQLIKAQTQTARKHHGYSLSEKSARQLYFERRWNTQNYPGNLFQREQLVVGAPRSNIT